MCVVSNIGDYYSENYNDPFGPLIPPNKKELIPVKEFTEEELEKSIDKWIEDNKLWDLKKYKVFKKLLDAAKRLDALMGDEGCEDPLKVKWINELDELIRRMKMRMKKKSKRGVKKST